jgi:hypothetical protein
LNVTLWRNERVIRRDAATRERGVGCLHGC